jgi:hypothetical protein
LKPKHNRMRNSIYFRLSSIVALMIILGASLTSCKDDDDNPPDNNNASINLKIYDSRLPQDRAREINNGIIIAEDLTLCEITFSTVQLKNTDGDYVNLLESSETVDLRNFQGTIGDLASAEVPTGDYTELRIAVSGVSTTYQGNNYTASVSGSATASLAQTPGITYTEAQGVPDAFENGELVFDYPLVFSLDNADDYQNIHIQFDVDASAYVVSFTYQTHTWNFAGLRPLLHIGIILEQGIQQIYHSPPLGITVQGLGNVSYYGIHTFMDFHQLGGTINSHTSQHVYRGTDGSLMIDAEDMEINNTALNPSEISATGETDVRADEIFDYVGILTRLATEGHVLESGNTYYFSLRKTWNITTGDATYDLTRMCEPMPVSIP